MSPRASHPSTAPLPVPPGEDVTSIPWPARVRARVAGRIERSPRYRWWVLWTVLAGLFSVNVTFTVFAVALPRVAAELGTTANTLTWVITGPMIAFGVAAPSLGRAGDIWGHKRLYLAGMVGAMVCAALSAVAWNAGSLIVFRTLGSLEGAATGAASMALIFGVFDRDDRVKAMGFWSLVGAGGPVIGVALGGIVIEQVGWRWVFVAQVPLGLAALVLAAVVLPETERTSRGAVDWAGIFTLGIGVTGLLFGLNRGTEWGWDSPAVIAAFALSPVLLALFVAVERRAVEPLIPLEYFRRRNFAFPMASQTLTNFAYMGGFILAPQLLADIYGYGESRIGFLVLARPLAFSLLAPVAGYAAVRVGERSSAVVGAVGVVGSMVMFANLTTGSSDLMIVAALVLSGVGLGIATPSIAATVGNSVDEGSFGVVSATQQITTQIGIVAGIQLMKTVQASGGSGLAGFRTAYLLGGAVAALGVVCAAFVRSDSRTRPAPNDALPPGG